MPVPSKKKPPLGQLLIDQLQDLNLKEPFGQLMELIKGLKINNKG